MSSAVATTSTLARYTPASCIACVDAITRCLSTLRACFVCKVFFTLNGEFIGTKSITAPTNTHCNKKTEHRHTHIRHRASVVRRSGVVGSCVRGGQAWRRAAIVPCSRHPARPLAPLSVVPLLSHHPPLACLCLSVCMSCLFLSMLVFGVGMYLACLFVNFFFVPITFVLDYFLIGERAAFEPYAAIGLFSFNEQVPISMFL